MPISSKILKRDSTSETTRTVPLNLDTITQDSRTLWESFCEGSESAFVELYNRYFQILYNLGRQYSGDTALLKDCLQEVFITIRKNRGKLNKVVSVKAYLLRCYRNKVIAEHKKRSKRMLVDFSRNPLEFRVVPSHESVLIHRQFNQEQVQKLHRAINTLTHRQREAIYHFYYNGLSYTQIKGVMGFGSTRAARNLIYRSLRELRKFSDR